MAYADRVRGSALLLCLLAAVPVARADPTVLASDDLPEALAPALVRGRVDGPLAWPLPAGDVLLLGRVDRDPAAQRIASALGLLDPLDALAGGYALARWRDGGRTLACVFADGAVPLRVGFGVLGARPAILEGVHVARPRFARRVLQTAGPVDTALAGTAIEAAATDVVAPGGGEGGRLARHGVLLHAAIPDDLAAALAAGRALRVDLPALWGRPGAPPRIPYVPDAVRRGRSAAIVVAEGPGAAEILEAAAFGAGDALWPTVLDGRLPRRWSHPADLLRRAAGGLEAAPADPRGWRPALARHLRIEAGRLPSAVLEIPLVPAAPRDDGRLDEPGWAYAARLAVPSPEGRTTLLAFSDGSALHLALRQRGRPIHHRLVLRDAVAGTLRIDLPASGPPTFDAERGRATGAARAPDADGRTAELSVDRDALGGEPYPTRMVALAVQEVTGDTSRTLWAGTLLVVP